MAGSVVSDLLVISGSFALTLHSCDQEGPGFPAQLSEAAQAPCTLPQECHGRER